jgi:predicted dehydrogenase
MRGPKIGQEVSIVSKLRIGFVGVGGMGQCAHLKNYAVLPDCEVVALAELRPGLAQRVAAKYGVPRVYADHRELLAAEKLDGIVAPQPFTRHTVLVPELLEAGVPIFIEKPLASTLEGGRGLALAVADSGTWVMLGYHKRSDPATAWAKAEIERLQETGELGRLNYVRVLMPAGDWVAGGFSDLLRSDEPLPALEREPAPSDLDEAGYQQYVAFVNYYIHQVNLLRFLLGEPYEVTHADPAGVLLVAASASGVTGTIEMSPYVTTVDWQESALVCFEHGWIRVDLPAPLASNRPGRVEVYHDPGLETTPRRYEPQLPWIHAEKAQAMNFLAAIRGEKKPPCEAAEAAEDLRIAREYLRLWKGV